MHKYWKADNQPTLRKGRQIDEVELESKKETLAAVVMHQENLFLSFGFDIQSQLQFFFSQGRLLAQSLVNSIGFSIVTALRITQ